MRDRIRRLLGAKRPDSHLVADGTIARADGRFRLELVVRAGDLVGTRNIESNSCEDLAGAAAVELGLLIHSAEAVRGPASTPPTLPPGGGAEVSGLPTDGTGGHPSQGAGSESTAERAHAQTKAETKPEAEREAKEQPPAAKSQRSWRALLQAPLLALGVGPLPQRTIGGGLALGLDYAKWQWQIKAITWRRQSVPAADFPGYGADVDRISADFWACREFRSDWLGFSPCLTVGVERVSARGTGQNIVANTQNAIGMTAGAGAQGRLYLASWISLLIAAGGQIEVSRPVIFLGGVGSVYQFSPAALSFTVGLEWIL